MFENGRPGTQWLRLSRGGYGRGDLYFAGENPAPGLPINFYLKDTPKGAVEVEITDATGSLKTKYAIKEAKAGVNRLLWDMRFDPPAEQLKQNLTQMRQMMERILSRPEVEEEPKKIVQEALEKLQEPGLSYRDAAEIQRKAYETIGFGGFMRYRGGGRGMGATDAEPGTYAVKLSVNGNTFVGNVTVRQDPMLSGKGS